MPNIRWNNGNFELCYQATNANENSKQWEEKSNRRIRLQIYAEFFYWFSRLFNL